MRSRPDPRHPKLPRPHLRRLHAPPPQDDPPPDHAPRKPDLTVHDGGADPDDDGRITVRWKGAHDSHLLEACLQAADYAIRWNSRAARPEVRRLPDGRWETLDDRHQEHIFETIEKVVKLNPPHTFTPTLYEQTPRLNLLTWGSPLLTRLLTHLDP